LSFVGYYQVNCFAKRKEKWNASKLCDYFCKRYETGGVVFSGLSADYQQKYGLANWITLERSIVTVAARSTQNIKFEIRNDETLSPGGHYGAIVVKPDNPAKKWVCELNQIDT